MPESRLFKPLKIGNMEIKHRVAMAPLTRLRATDDRVPTPMMKDYYGQRASEPGTLIIAEGTFASSNCGGFPNAPGIWRDDQVAAWRTITDEVHGKGSFIVAQIFLMGRAANTDTAEKEGNPIVAPSAIPIGEGYPVPRAMTKGEVKQVVVDHVVAAKNAIRAGFDAVEVHGANGYMLDQFLQDVSNHRDDEYGGSVENRTRLLDEVIKAVVAAIGKERVGLRLSPWGVFQGMGMEDPVPQFTDVINKAKESDLAYLHLIGYRSTETAHNESKDKIDFVYGLWDGPLLVAGGYQPKDARELVDKRHPERDVIVVFGRHFLANPDFVFRVRGGIELNPYDRNTFYTNKSPVGYVDYPASKEFLALGV